NGAFQFIRGAPFRFSRANYRDGLVAIVSVVIPIAIGMPTMAVFIPPAMPLIPAAFPCFVQLPPRVIRLPAVPAVVFRGFVEFVVRLGDAALTTIVVLGRCPGCSRKRQHAKYYC